MKKINCLLFLYLFLAITSFSISVCQSINKKILIKNDNNDHDISNNNDINNSFKMMNEINENMEKEEKKVSIASQIEREFIKKINNEWTNNSYSNSQDNNIKDNEKLLRLILKQLTQNKIIEKMNQNDKRDNNDFLIRKTEKKYEVKNAITDKLKKIKTEKANNQLIIKRPKFNANKYNYTKIHSNNNSSHNNNSSLFLNQNIFLPKLNNEQNRIQNELEELKSLVNKANKMKEDLIMKNNQNLEIKKQEVNVKTYGQRLHKKEQVENEYLSRFNQITDKLNELLNIN